MISVEDVMRIRDSVAAPERTPLPAWLATLGRRWLPSEPSAAEGAEVRSCMSTCPQCSYTSCECYYGPGVCGTVCIDLACDQACSGNCGIGNCLC